MLGQSITFTLSFFSKAVVVLEVFGVVIMPDAQSLMESDVGSEVQEEEEEEEEDFDMFLGHFWPPDWVFLPNLDQSRTFPAHFLSFPAAMHFGRF